MVKNSRELSPKDVIIAEDALMEFQFAVLKAMRDQKISKAQLAEKLGISRARMSQMLSPDANPTLKVVGRVVEALDLKARYVSKDTQSISFNIDPKIDFFSPAANTALSGQWASFTGYNRVWHNDNSRKSVRSDEPIAA